MNVELLLKVKEAILNNPEGFQMGKYFKQPENNKIRDYGLEWETRCGTACCIGGHAISLSGTERPLREEKYIPGEIYEIAKRALGLTDEQAGKLFYTAHWPVDLYREFSYSKSITKRAQIAAEVIDRFIVKN